MLAQGEVFAGRPDFYKVRQQRIAAATLSAGEDRRITLAVRRRLHPRGPSLPRLRGGSGRSGSQCPAGARRRPETDLPHARARDAVQRPQDRPRRAAARFLRCASTCCSTPGMPRTSSRCPARRASPWRCSTRGPRVEPPSRSVIASPSWARTSAPARGSTFPPCRSRRCTTSSTLRSISSPTSILHPAFRQGEVDRLKKQRLAQIQREKADPVGLALRVFPDSSSAEGHAYANPLERLGHRSLDAEDHPRGPGEVPRDLVQAQPRDACRGGRDHAWRRSCPGSNASSRDGSRATCRTKNLGRVGAAGRIRRSTCSTGRVPSSR